MPNYIYNGVELPALPDVTKYNTAESSYDYAFIFKNLVRGGISIAFFRKPVSKYYRQSPFNNYCMRTFPLEEIDYYCEYTLNESNEWEEDTFVLNANPKYLGEKSPYIVLTGVDDKENYEIIWSNHDIVDNDNGGVYFAGNDPVPVEPEPLYRDNATITLGSGTLYLTDYDGETLPAVETVCVEENRMGYTKGGAALQYTEETTEEKDDLGLAYKIITTKTDVVLKCGLITWNAYTLYKLIDRCTVEIQDGKRVVKIGGKGNENGNKYVVVFHHEDPIDGDLWALIVGRNTAGFTITCTNEAGALIEPEFKALPHDTEGTLVRLIEGSLTRTN